MGGWPSQTEPRVEAHRGQRCWRPGRRCSPAALHLGRPVWDQKLQLDGGAVLSGSFDPQQEVLHGAALAAGKLQSLVEPAGLVGPQLGSDVVEPTWTGPPHLRQELWMQDVRTASTCNAET